MEVIVYVLFSQSCGKLYVGITKDLNRRLTEHNQGRSKFTSTYRPWNLIYSELQPDYKEARKREKYLKSAAGKAWLKKRIG